MADDDSDSSVVERLERALARIEACVEQPDPAPAAMQTSVQAEVAARLDAVIARLRAELEG